MIHYGKETKLQPGQVIEKAREFFGPGGLGLEITDEAEGCMRLEGGGGYVSVVCCEIEKGTDVDLEAREWEYQVKKFMEQL